MEKQTNVSASGYGWGSTVELQMAWRRQARSKWATWFDKNLNKPHMGRFSETNVPEQQGVQFMRTMRTRDGGRKLIGGAEMVPLNPFHQFEFFILVKMCLFLIHQAILLDINNWTAFVISV